MARIDWRRDGSAEIDVAKPKHKIIRFIHHSPNVLDAREPVHAAYKLQVARTPWRIRANALLIPLDRKLCSRVIPRQRETYDARRDTNRFERRQLAVQLHKQVACLANGNAGPVDMHLQRPDARRQIEHRNDPAVLYGLHQRMDLEPELQIELHRPIFN
ncbi:hypothetical protein D3C84_931910 [compost metagenome]